MSEQRVQVTFDAVMLGLEVKTGVYRVCAELLPRLAARPELVVTCTSSRPEHAGAARAWLAAHDLNLSWRTGPRGMEPPIDVLLSTFYAPQPAWQRDGHVCKATIVYDLIPLLVEAYRTPGEVARMQETLASLGHDSCVFAISEHTKRDLLAQRPDLLPGQIEVLPLAAGESFVPCRNAGQRAAVRARYGIPPRGRFVLALATMEPRRNLPHLVRGFARLVEAHPGLGDVRLVLAGLEGIGFADLLRSINASEKLRERIIFTGFVRDEDLAPLYSEATCFTCMSTYEGFGLPVLEAMQCGTPVIAADATSLPEVVGEAGVLLPPDDLDGLVAALHRLLKSGAARRRLGALGRRRAARFSWDRSADRLVESLLRAHREYRLPALPLSAAADHSVEFGVGPELGPLCGAAPSEEERWPGWRERLARPRTGRRAEGGRRISRDRRTIAARRPRFSYITVVRNNATLLPRCIRSVQAQTLGDVEHILVDGASTDGTLEVIKQHAASIDYFVSEPDSGLYQALNKAVPLARGAYICVLNSDDWLEPAAAEIAWYHLRGRQDPVLLASSAHVHGVNGENATWSPALVHPGSYLLCANDCHNAIYASRAAYQSAGLYDASLRIAADFKWIMRCLDVGVSFVYTCERTVNYSMGGASADVAQHSREYLRIVRERFPFLSASEAQDLYWCFFSFVDTSGPHMDFVAPARRLASIQEILARHAGQAELVQALAWASAARLTHPADAAPAPADSFAPAPAFAVEAGPVASVRALLRGSPRLYAMAKRLYRSVH